MPTLLDPNDTIEAVIALILMSWDGLHERSSNGPSVYYTTMSWIWYYAFQDELGNKDARLLMNSEIMKRSYLNLFSNDSSRWWDNIHTKLKESREDVVHKAVKKSWLTLSKNTGSNNQVDWKWDILHKVTHHHPLGQVSFLKRFFDVGPLSTDGGNEVINNMMFKLDTTGIFNVIASPAVRTVIDLGNMNEAQSINPTGQSGNVLSKHFADQSEMFTNVEFRPQLIDKKGITQHTQSTLTLSPLK